MEQRQPLVEDLWVVKHVRENEIEKKERERNIKDKYQIYIMLPIEVIIYIFSYLGVKPNRRCKSITQKGKMCKNRIHKGSYNGFFCLTHIKKLGRINSSLQRDFVERCIMMYSSIKNRERTISRLENLRLWKEEQAQEHKRRRRYLTSHSGGGTFNHANIILQYGQF